ILSKYERKEEIEEEIYCGLKGVKFTNIQKEINPGYFVTFVRASNDFTIAQFCQGSNGCILKFHPSMRRAGGIKSCDVSWLLPSLPCREILFANTPFELFLEKEIISNFQEWSARIESEDKNSQVILLTWDVYDKYIQQALEISAMWNNAIDLNLIYIGLFLEKKITLSIKWLSEFEKWKVQNNNAEIYKLTMHKFYQRRCCNDSLNLFTLFLEDIFKCTTPSLFDIVIRYTADIGLPFVEKDKFIEIKKIT
ncbi:hypothetical protein RFI_29162, partial [Reticulomyxa filosa]